MKYNDIFNTRTLNIFTDASIHRYDKDDYRETIGSPGAIAVETDENGDSHIISEYKVIERNTTSNKSEIKAIDMGVLLAFNLRNSYDTINLFSDSKLCIKGLTEWIFSWVRNIQNDRLYSSSGTEVKNQETFISIVNFIAKTSLNINFYHQKGHVTSSDKSIINAKEVFSISNQIPLNAISDDLIKKLSYYNNYIDIKTKNEIEDFLDNTQVKKVYLDNIYHLKCSNINIDKYKNHINYIPKMTSRKINKHNRK